MRTHGNVAKKILDNQFPEGELSELVSQIIRGLMRDGKSSLARRILYQAISKAAARLTESQKSEIGEYSDIRELEAKMVMFIIDRITPRVEVKSKRVGGANYQVPIVVNKKRGTALAIRWLIEAARDRSQGASMVDKLSNVMYETVEGKSAAITKKETQDKMANANRANANLVRRTNPSQEVKTSQ